MCDISYITHTKCVIFFISVCNMRYICIPFPLILGVKVVCVFVCVTEVWKTDHLRTFHNSRNTNLKY